jgi:hypothetical protein
MAAASPFPTIAVPLEGRERRRAERVPASMPMSIGGGSATTQDLSATGLSFLSERPYAAGDRVQVTIHYLLDGHNYPLECQAEVMRVQHGPDGYTIGARLLPQSQLEDVAVPADAARLRSVD